MARTDPDKPTTVRFYQLGVSNLEAAIASIIAKAWAKGVKSTLLTPGPDQSRFWDGLLWQSPPGEFIPHGPADGADPKLQPILIATDEDDRNGASLIVLTTPRLVKEPQRFDLVIDFVDGTSQEALNASRSRYKHYMDMGLAMEYWIQDQTTGKWSLKK